MAIYTLSVFGVSAFIDGAVACADDACVFFLSAVFFGVIKFVTVGASLDMFFNVNSWFGCVLWCCDECVYGVVEIVWIMFSELEFYER